MRRGPLLFLLRLAAAAALAARMASAAWADTSSFTLHGKVLDQVSDIVLEMSGVRALENWRRSPC